MPDPSIANRPLSYEQRLERRSPEIIEGVVIHATELPNLAMAREYGKRIHYADSRTGNSGHFYIDRNGSIEQWVSLDRVAHHVAGHNARTIGIELVNLGRYPNWLASDHQHWQESVTEAQIKALIDLLNALRRQLPGLSWIAGHDQLDTREVPASDEPAKTVRRKLDPGPDFPWSRVSHASTLKQLPDSL